MVASAPAMGGAWVAKTASCAPSFGSTTLRVGRRGPLVSLARRTRTPERGTESGWSPSAPALDKPHGPVVAWLRKLGPSWTSSERTYEHCVSPSPGRPQRQGHAPPQVAETPPSTSIEGKASKLGGIIYMAVLVQARSERPISPHRRREKETAASRR